MGSTVAAAREAVVRPRHDGNLNGVQERLARRSAVPRTAAEITALDAAHVWHPYGGFPATTEPLVVASAAGTRLTLADGRELIDGMSSWWAAVHGYRHPVLDAALVAQSERMSHVMFGGLTHEPAVRLAELLVELTPAGLDKVFLCDSGSISVEVAVKMCLQYWRALGRPGKHRLLTWRGGYHGDTFTPMSVCDPEGGMHALWTDVLAEQIFAPMPPHDYDPEYVALLEQLIAAHADEVAAVIVEPIVQGAGGMRFHHPDYLRDLRRLCDAHGILLIFDEIATGFGRTGTLFAADAAGVTPDVMCVGKALTGGYLTLAAAVTTTAIAETISAAHGGLMHGPTFMGNPLACAVAVASTELLLARDWRREVADIEAGLRAGLAPARAVPGVADVRVLGAIGVVELDGPVDMRSATRAAVDAGVWLRPFRNLVYTMPPFISTPEDVAAIANAVVAAAASERSR
ncbi:adenosylmethionine--8-amino-7-oxononanoate transaminase [Nocardia stercoris]|uniref:Adenosylmethionine-8-amino-7-oxononanoate aminotransferase n=1 Tax=Nocardia stercoris TaxID=2483361 RepID=A0A3M2KU29_9NOCA|nr:adenosylmethionine--8-amino-7-oxononanoate transaminase [Nocardia stercoris]